MKNEKNKNHEKLEFRVNYIKKNLKISLFSSFCVSQQKNFFLWLPPTHGTRDKFKTNGRDTKQSSMTEVCYVFILGSWSGSRECKIKRAATNQALVMGRKIMKEAVPRLWRHPWPFSIYRRGLISTLFPCSHMSRCGAGPGSKRVALSRPGR